MNIIDKSNTRTEVEFKDKKLTIIGTAHISGDSVQEVKDTITEINPDLVCVEIDNSRYKTKTEGNNWENMDLIKVFRQKKGFLLLANLVLSSFQKRLGVDVGTAPGEDMIGAVTAAQEAKINFSFIDREIQTTLTRAWRTSNFWNRMKLLSALLASAFTNEKVTPEDIEALKKKSALDGMMDELSGYLPSVKRVLIDERDQFLAAKSFASEGKNVLVVVGAGHVPGMLKWFKKFEDGEANTDVSEIDVIPPKTVGQKMLPWIIPSIIILIFALGFAFSGVDKTLDKIVQWVLINGTLSAVGSIIALANPITVLASFISAPITSLNPLMGVGFITGPLEAILRKPTVKDFTNLSDDITSIKGFYKNRLSHILLVFFLSSLGSAIGTFVGAAFMSTLFSDIVKKIVALF